MIRRCCASRSTVFCFTSLTLVVNAEAASRPFVGQKVIPDGASSVNQTILEKSRLMCEASLGLFFGSRWAKSAIFMRSGKFSITFLVYCAYFVQLIIAL